MSQDPKYSARHIFSYPERTWPDQKISSAPTWCSVDLRDGNQALINPMDLRKKLKFFKTLCAMGFRELEVGFPSASQIEYDFVRKLIEEKLIPKGVRIQVLTQSRQDLITKTMEAIKGAPEAIVHLYNSTSVDQRAMVFAKNKAEIIKIALNGVDWIKESLSKDHGMITLEYSPESFTGTEPDYALEICEAVYAKWHEGGAPSDEKVIINLPATVELYGPQHFADRIEWFSKNFSARDGIIISLHTHNDRGTGVAATELAILAGGERVEGTLFGNGERTGNVDIITLALNLYTHGIDPKLDVYDLPALLAVSDDCTEIPIGKRHPYAGELVFTAFSGSHQDAINKGLAYRRAHKLNSWRVPYLPIDPQDVGREYKAIIRINSQSGKGGLSYIMEQVFEYKLPKRMQAEFSKYVQQYSEKHMGEVSPQTIYDIFESTYIKQNQAFISFQKIHPEYLDENRVRCSLTVTKYYEREDKEKEIILIGEGNGPIDAAKLALENITGPFEILDYYEHSLSCGSSAKAIAYIEVKYKNQVHFGTGIDTNITAASLKGLISALNFFFPRDLSKDPLGAPSKDFVVSKKQASRK